MSLTMLPNSARLVRMERPYIPEHDDQRCEQCGGKFDKPDHWYVRYSIRSGQSQDSALLHGNDVGCSEVCARAMYEARLMEIALITGGKPQLLTHRELRQREQDSKR